MTDSQIEQEIQAKDLTAPRVTPGDIEANIVGESYFTAADGVRGASVGKPGESLLHEYVTHEGGPLSLLTFCVLVLRNGFTVTGESACASPENFDPELGRKIARQNAINKVWPLMGYELKCRLFEQALETSYQDRVVVEAAELKDRIDKLEDFLVSPEFCNLPKDEQKRLWAQFDSMLDYFASLEARIEAFKG